MKESWKQSAASKAPLLNLTRTGIPMVKTKSPLMSAEASGTLANQLTFLNTRRGCTIRRRVLPCDKRSGAQLGRRVFFSFLTKQWTNISGVDQQSWGDLVTTRITSYYNAYVSENLHFWPHFQAPSEAFPIARAAGLGVIAAGPNAYLEQGDIRIAVAISPVWSNWGIMYFASLSTGFTTAIDNLIGCVRLTATGSTSWTWRPPNAGPWFFNARLFTDDGKLGAQLGQFTL